MKYKYHEDRISDEEFVQMINNQYHQWGIYSPYWALVTAFKIASCFFLLFVLAWDFYYHKGYKRPNTGFLYRWDSSSL